MSLTGAAPAALAEQVLATRYSRWGRLRELRPLGDGWDNDNLLVTSDAGRSAVLRRYRLSTPSEVAAEIELLEMLDHSGFPTPRLVRTDSGAGSCAHGDAPWALFEYIADCRYPRLEQWPIALELMQRLHLLGQGFRGPAVRARFADLGERFARVPSGRFDATDMAFLQRVAADERTLCRALLDEPDPRVRVSCVHYDVNPRNVLLDPEGQAWLVDFDECCFAPITQDLAGFVHYWSISEAGHLDLEHARAVVAAYHAQSNLTSAELLRLPAELLRYQLRDCLKYCLSEMDENPSFQLAHSTSFKALAQVYEAFHSRAWRFL